MSSAPIGNNDGAQLASNKNPQPLAENAGFVKLTEDEQHEPASSDTRKQPGGGEDTDQSKKVGEHGEGFTTLTEGK